jgi:UDP-N-acetylmuramate: L-alanyl-gamma-D-glutamyl-meso-diaminopimelate ligase
MIAKRAHFIGIGGVGMSATAKLLKDTGVEVTGSDEAVYPPVSAFLEGASLPYKTPYAAENIPADADLIVIGKNARLVPETNEEVASALASGKKIMSFPEVLGELSVGQQSVVVAGSYGKSTTTALLSHCLLEAGKDPSFFIGAVPYTPYTSSAIGKGELFVFEGDEYPASNTDRRSKFLLLRPAHVLITPLAHDHINIFPTIEEYMKPFAELVSILPQNGSLVVCAEGPLSLEFIRSLSRDPVTYGLSEGEWQAKNIEWGEHTSFTLTRSGKEVARLQTSQLGAHNIQNIVGVGAFLLSNGIMTPEEFAQGVRTFAGIRRRLDRKSDKTLIPIYEGFGSSHEKLRSAIAAMKLHFPDRRLIVIFEPNTITWRSRAALAQYDTAFVDAGLTYVYNPPHDGKETELSLEEIVARINSAGIRAQGVATAEDTLAAIKNELTANDAILLSSSGAMGGLVESVPALAEKKFPR